MNAGTVSLLLILGGNPVYTAPSDLKFAEALDKVPLRASLGQFHDETAALCHWHIPETHFLEMWSDVRGHDGTTSIVQPLIAPLYDGRSIHEVVSTLSDRGVRSGYDIVRSYWSGRRARRRQRQSRLLQRLQQERRSRSRRCLEARRSRRSIAIGDDGSTTA